MDADLALALQLQVDVALVRKGLPSLVVGGSWVPN